MDGTLNQELYVRDASGNPIWFGYAPMNAATTDNDWTITQKTFDINGQITSVKNYIGAWDTITAAQNS